MIDPTGHAWYHWAIAAVVVVAAVAAVVVTAGGAAPALIAAAAVVNGCVAATTASTAAIVTAGVAVGAGMALTTSAVEAAQNSESIADFWIYGENAMYSTFGGCFFGAIDGYMLSSCKPTISAFPDSTDDIDSAQPKGPYSNLVDGPDVGEGQDFTAGQKKLIIEENKRRNSGSVVSDSPDDYYDVLTQPQKSIKGVSPGPDEWQIDHIVPKSLGGSNSYSNAQVISRRLNREKWNN